MNRNHASGPERRPRRRRLTGRTLAQSQPLGRPTAVQMGSMLDHASEAIMAADLSGRLTYWNRAAERMYGFRSSEVLGKEAYFLYPPEDHATLTAHFEQIKRGEPVRQYEARHIARNGKRITVLMTLSPMFDENGQISGLSAINLDITQRKQMESALRESQETLFHAQRIARIGSWEWDVRHKRLRWTPELNRLYGLPDDHPREATYAEWLRHIHPEDRRRVHREIRFALRSKKPHGFDFRIIKPNGVLCWMHGEGLARLEDGRHLRFTGTIQDINERKLLEDSLRESEARYYAMLDTAPEGLWLIDAEAHTTFINRCMAEMLGYKPEEILGRSLHEFVLPVDRQPIEIKLSIERISDPTEWELRFLHRNGSHFWVHAHAKPICNPTGELIGALAVVRNIEKHKLHEAKRNREVQAIRDQQAWLEAVIQNSPLGIALIRKQAAPLRLKVNPRFAQLVGSSHELEIPLERLTGLFFDAEGKMCDLGEMAIMAAMRGETRFNIEKRLIRRVGEPLPVLVHAAPISLQNGSIAGAIMMVEDIGARKVVERLRQEWSSLIAHELKQPAGNIILRTEMLRALAKFDADTLRHHTDPILASAKLIERMVDDLQDVSSLESQHLTMRLQKVCLVQLLRRHIMNAQANYPDRRIRLFAHSEEVEVLADMVRLEQVLSNLISNAGKYGYPNTDIVVELEDEVDHAHFSVCNYGPGIEPEHLPSLFSRFYRAHEAAKRAGGLGLGLYMVRGLIEAHGGTVWAESEPGKTTTFHVRLPKQVGIDRQSKP